MGSQDSQTQGKETQGKESNNGKIEAVTESAAGHSPHYQPYNNQYSERPKAGAMEVIVEHNVEKAMRIMKRKLIKEALFKELKSRRYYEKPSVRKKRKQKEAQKKQRKEEARVRKMNVS